LREADRSLFEGVVRRLESAWSPLPDKPEETLELTAKALWFAAVGDPRSVARCNGVDIPPLSEAGAERLQTLLTLRIGGTPLAHLTGRQTFAGLEMLSGPGALIPRRETELLARTAAELVDEALNRSDEVVAIDMCTGSGNVALALAARHPRVRVCGADISPGALQLAERNAVHLGLSSRVVFVASDLFEAIDAPRFQKTAAVITCNPPYIASAKVSAMPTEISAHEPRQAFDGGAFGLSVITRLVSDAPRFLRPSGSLCFEVGAGNGRFWSDRLERNGAFSRVRRVDDESGILRVLVATVA
jgi:release factor glutamine methyltransferase